MMFPPTYQSFSLQQLSSLTGCHGGAAAGAAFLFFSSLFFNVEDAVVDIKPVYSTVLPL